MSSRSRNIFIIDMCISPQSKALQTTSTFSKSKLKHGSAQWWMKPFVIVFQDQLKLRQKLHANDTEITCLLCMFHWTRRPKPRRSKCGNNSIIAISLITSSWLNWAIHKPKTLRGLTLKDSRATPKRYSMRINTTMARVEPIFSDFLLQTYQPWIVFFFVIPNETFCRHFHHEVYCRAPKHKLSESAAQISWKIQCSWARRGSDS